MPLALIADFNRRARHCRDIRNAAMTVRLGNSIGFLIGRLRVSAGLPASRLAPRALCCPIDNGAAYGNNLWIDARRGKRRMPTISAGSDKRDVIGIVLID